MKKHHVVLIIVLANFGIFSTYLYLWLGSDMYNAKEAMLFPILIVSYLMPTTLLGLFILLSKQLNTNQKAGWIAYVMLTNFIGCIHFYLKYKAEINRITLETNKKMKGGPDSLSEFDSSSHR